MNTRKIATILFFLPLWVQFIPAENIFTGKPILRIVEAGVTREIHYLDSDSATEYQCIIAREGGQYFWASRDYTELIYADTGFFKTYVAVNGSGLIRVFKKEFKEFGPEISETESQFDYVEYLLRYLQSVTYYGIVLSPN